mmetsp:Transcript_36403/g.66079  ORF Transcript_36403/g.66079 Transcript_36403/m.66079 type:complete len:96 (+) Transcript_36403:125-412(+)
MARQGVAAVLLLALLVSSAVFVSAGENLRNGYRDGLPVARSLEECNTIEGLFFYQNKVYSASCPNNDCGAGVQLGGNTYYEVGTAAELHMQQADC